MGILARFFTKHEERANGGVGVEPLLPFPTFSTGGYISPHYAENLSTVMACVSAIGGTLGSLNAYVYQQHQTIRKEAPNHPVSRLIKAPNATQTWPDWIEWVMGQALLHGNALSIVEYDGAGRPTALTPVPWTMAIMVRLPSGRIAYDITLPLQSSRRYFAEDIFHPKDRSDDGLLGRSRISRAPEVLQNALSLQEWNNAMWRNQATPSGAVELEQQITEEHYLQLRKQFDESFTGVQNARKTLILDNNAKWKPLSVSPEDAEVLASRRFSVEELCRLFQVPPPIVQDYTHNTFTNASQASLWFAQITLTPWVKKIEAEFK